MNTRKVFNKVMSLVLAVMMMVGVVSTIAPQQAEAAAAKSFKGSGTSSVTIKDMDCYDWDTYDMQTHWIKFKAKTNGYVTLKFSNASEVSSYSLGYVTLCNNKKKALGISEESWDTGSKLTYNHTKSYGVRKGKTYYFKIQAAAGVKIKATVKTVKKSTATSIKKAKTLAKNKTAKGVIIAGEKKADWYKIKLTGKQKVALTCSIKINGSDEETGIKLSLYDADKKALDGSLVLTPLVPKKTGIACEVDYYTGAQTGLEPGTYYVKVERYNKYSSGYYTLKWK